MPTPFASSADINAKTVTFEAIAEGIYAFTAEGDPNTGVVVGEKSVLVFDAQATPGLAENVLSAIRDITSLPVHYVVLSHYHAVRTLGASAFSKARVVASLATDQLISERGAQDMESELRRFPRLFQGAERISGLTYPDILFEESLKIDLGGRRVEVIHPGAGHTGGDTILWIPDERVLFAGDLVENGATPYCGDAYLHQWPVTLSTLADLDPERLVPGRGGVLKSSESAQLAIESTRRYVSRLMFYATEAVDQKMGLSAVYRYIRKKMDQDYGDWVIYEHCMPFNVSRAFDEVSEIPYPEIWTYERDQKMWELLEG
ncbi:MBL fold metallo-hydrolase [Endozoicomonas numazuensis]|uniref:Beta-lactamase n=1 Tax=Endozoicomonas numazuensis TaxID=1137799 RepID=A0A081NKC1_9GAMM|nr:MBL fold metallo-hydrolase [Endozoicomonas numazuensis]KEQ18894.1 beta-lactamase [Endozoicomonas numazuensis]